MRSVSAKSLGSAEGRSSVWTTFGSGRAADRAATEQQKGLLKLAQIRETGRANARSDAGEPRLQGGAAGATKAQGC